MLETQIFADAESSSGCFPPVLQEQRRTLETLPSSIEEQGEPHGEIRPKGWRVYR